MIKQLSHLPVIADPSHATGRWEYVAPTAKAAIAAGADGLIIEVHPRPDEAWSDGRQSLKPERFAQLVKEAAAVAQAVGRTLPQRAETAQVSAGCPGVRRTRAAPAAGARSTTHPAA